jgi:hypothetical protein
LHTAKWRKVCHWTRTLMSVCHCGDLATANVSTRLSKPQSSGPRCYELTTRRLHQGFTPGEMGSGVSVRGSNPERLIAISMTVLCEKRTVAPLQIRRVRLPCPLHRAPEVSSSRRELKRGNDHACVNRPCQCDSRDRCGLCFCDCWLCISGSGAASVSGINSSRLDTLVLTAGGSGVSTMG